jgi:hypothetical protein
VNGRHCTAQFLPIVAIAWISERAEPLVAMGLRNNGARAHDFPTLAPSVAGSAERAQASLGRRPVWSLGQSPLASRLSRAINVENQKVGCQFL